MKPIWMRLQSVLHELRDDETGAAESAQIFAWIVVTVIAVMAFGALLEALGVEVIEWVRDQIGLG